MATVNTDQLTMPGRVVRLRTLVLAAGVVSIALVACLLINGGDNKGSSDGHQLNGNGKNDYTLSYPDSWRPLSSTELARQPGQPLAVIRRKDGKGFVVLRREGRAPRNFTGFSSDLSRALSKRVPDYQKRSSKVIKIAAGQAFFFSYIRKTKGTVHTIVLVPAGKRSYVLNTVSSGASQSVARQIARIILSFKA
jgi:hypothetical protein